MIEVKKILMKEDCFKGDSYFYVDDSVIYVQSELEQTEFVNRIDLLNTRLEEYCRENCNTNSDIEDVIPKEYLGFHNKLLYQIKFHRDTKSTFCHIDDADNHLGGFENLTRETSMSSKLAYNLDEIDDTVSFRKLKAIDQVIEKEIKRIKGEEDNRKEIKGKDASRLKMLQRFKKFFLYRNRLLKIKTEGGPNPEFYYDFKKRFFDNNNNLKEWFDQCDEDIFQSEYRLLIQIENSIKAHNIYEAIKEFECKALKEGGLYDEKKFPFLFYSRDAECSVKMKTLNCDCYKTLIKWIDENYKGFKNLHSKDQFERFTAFLGINKGSVNQPITFKEILLNGFDGREYTKFIAKNSSEFQRRILNTYFSAIIGVFPSDALSFTKVNSRRLYYSELRVLAQLRNKRFEIEQFNEFVVGLNVNDVSNSMGIDMGLLEVLSTFINHVNKPEWVDNLILTHRITKGLWCNGSKFLNSYTLHNEEHAVTLINMALHIVNTIDYFALKDVDYYILFLACYLHDISMVIHPDLYMRIASNTKSFALISEQMLKMKEEVLRFKNIDGNERKNSHLKESGRFLVDIFNSIYSYFENEVREHHPMESAEFIRNKSDSLLKHLEPTLLSYVAKVSESHGYEVIDVYGLKSRAKDDTISLKYLMILLRLADLFDVAHDRVNYHLLSQNLKNMSPTSKFHWISHLVTDRIELSAEYEVDQEKKLIEKPITEVLNLDLILNVKYLTSDKSDKKCNCCKCMMKENCISIEILNSSRSKEICNQKHCIFLCRWMMKKHAWLISELVALSDYLYSVNNSLIRTKINFNIYYNNDMHLADDMFDCVQDYVN